MTKEFVFDRIEQVKYSEPVIHLIPEMDSETRKFHLVQNGLGQWWPFMSYYNEYMNKWCNMPIKDSNPYKTINAAIKYCQKYQAKWGKKHD